MENPFCYCGLGKSTMVSVSGLGWCGTQSETSQYALRLQKWVGIGPGKAENVAESTLWTGVREENFGECLLEWMETIQHCQITDLALFQVIEEEKKNPKHEEIRKAMKDLFFKLDLLTSYHYTPKPVSGFLWGGVL